MMKILAAALLCLFATAVAAQPAQPFAPITIDGAKYQQIDDAMAKLAMPREAHSAWINLWQGIERQAQMDQAAAEAKKKAEEKKAEPAKPAE